MGQDFICIALTIAGPNTNSSYFIRTKIITPRIDLLVTAGPQEMMTNGNLMCNKLIIQYINVKSNVCIDNYVMYIKYYTLGRFREFVIKISEITSEMAVKKLFCTLMLFLINCRSKTIKKPTTNSV